MLPSAHRMRRSSDFSAAVRLGRRVRRGSVVIHSAPMAASGEPDCGSEATSPLVGFVVAKSVGNSVIRHQVSRRLRGVVAARLSALPRGSATVVRALPSAAEATSAELAADIDAALHRLPGTLLGTLPGTAR